MTSLTIFLVLLQFCILMAVDIRASQRRSGNTSNGLCKLGHTYLSSVLSRLNAKLRKAPISFVMSVRTEQLGSHWTDFNEI